MLIARPGIFLVASAVGVWVTASGSTTGDNYAPHYPWLDPPAAAAPAAPAASQLQLSCAAAGHQAPAAQTLVTTGNNIESCAFWFVYKPDL